MNSQMNFIGIEGYLTDDVKLSYDDQKKCMKARFYIKNLCQVGNNHYGNDFYVVVYGKKAENCARHLSKGKKCAVTGKVSTWLKSEKIGLSQSGITIIASDVHFDEAANNSGNLDNQTGAQHE